MEMKKIIVYLKKETTGKIDFANIDYLENYFRELLLKLRDVYDINIKGFYNVKVYIDELYGMVLELEAEDIDYGDYYNQIEMRIIPIYTTFLYQVDDFINNIDVQTILYHDEFYLKIDKNISLKNYYLVMDYAKIVYNNTDNIIKYGKVLKHFNFKKIML